MKTLSYSAFLKRVKDAVKQYEMLDKGDKVLVAVSGGADSVCLLKALLEMREGCGIELVVANMDHGIRGKESKRDSEFVRELAENMGLEFVHKKVSIKTSRNKKISLEEQAREKRYLFLQKAADKYGCNVIATGHTMEDQAETVLMRVVYGVSAAGIAGIPPVRKEKDIRIIRPLIRISRHDIEGFLEKSGMKYVEDSSNKDVKFSRNKVRHEMLPFLEKYNPSLKRSLVNLSDSVREDYVFFNAEKEKVLSKFVKGRKKNDVVAIKIKDIILQPKALRKELFKELFKKAGGNIKKLTYRHWMDMDIFLRTAEKNKSLDFPGSIKVTKQRDEIVFGKRR